MSQLEREYSNQSRQPSNSRQEGYSEDCDTISEKHYELEDTAQMEQVGEVSVTVFIAVLLAVLLTISVVCFWVLIWLVCPRF